MACPDSKGTCWPIFTGYAPDTDSERGTLTINSPLDWAEKMAQSSDSMAGLELTDLDAAYAQSFKNFQSGRELLSQICHVLVFFLHFVIAWTLI